jgi:hypothetical protein
MAQQSSEIQQLIDRAAIHDLHTRYFQGLDRCSPEQVRTCFTEDVRAHYDKRTPTRSLNALIDSIQVMGKVQKGSLRISNHFMGNLVFLRIEGDTAETEVNAFAFLVEAGSGGDRVAMRSLRYLDRMRRQKDGWRISDRIHTLDWACDVPTTFAIAFKQRISVLPARS